MEKLKTASNEKTCKQQIGEKIYDAWKKGALKNLTQQGLAMRVNISASYLNEIINGKKTPPIEVISRIAHVLNVKEGELLPNGWCDIGNDEGDITAEIHSIKSKVQRMSKFELINSVRALVELLNDLKELFC